MNASEWNDLNKIDKRNKIIEVINSFNRPVKYDVDWYFNAIESSIYEGDTTSIDDKIKLISFISNAFGDSDEKILKLLSKCTDEEIKLYEYVEYKIKEFKDDKDITEKQFLAIIDNCANELHVSVDYLLSKWQKVDGARLGVDLNINN